jgi:cellular nucleic acid-binding protein
MGHIARNCTRSGGGFGGSYGGSGGYSGGGSGKTCYSCGGYGHMSRKSSSVFLRYRRQVEAIY